MDVRTRRAVASVKASLREASLELSLLGEVFDVYRGMSEAIDVVCERYSEDQLAVVGESLHEAASVGRRAGASFRP
jgi:hypothetical protein